MSGLHSGGEDAPAWAGIRVDEPKDLISGYKQSGIGREFGIEGLSHFLEHKAIYT